MTIDRRAIREDGKQMLEGRSGAGPVRFATTWLALLWIWCSSARGTIWPRRCARSCDRRA